MAVLVPESTAIVRRTVNAAVPVVVTVVCGEHHPVVVQKSVSCISTSCCPCVTRVPGYMHQVIGCLALDNKPTVLGVVPAAVATFL